MAIDVHASEALRLDDHATGVSVIGSGSPLLVIHAIGLDRRMWSETARRLAANHTVVSYDIRGHGQASTAPRATTIAQLADDAAEVLRTTAGGAADVVGLSLGGAVAQELALRHPAAVSNLVLCATLCKGQPAAAERAAEAEDRGVAAQITTTVERWFTPEFIRSRSDVIGYVTECLTAIPVDSWAATWRALADLDTRGRLAGIGVPTKVVGGSRDVSTPPAVLRDIAERVPGAVLEILDQRPHMLSLECPDELAAAVDPRLWRA